MQQIEQGMIANGEQGRLSGVGCGHMPVLQTFQNVIDRFDQCRAIPNQLVTAFGTWVMDRARNRINLASMFRRKTCSDQRAAGDTGLDHQHS